MDNVLKSLYLCFKKFKKTDNVLKLVFMLNKVNKKFF